MPFFSILNTASYNYTSLSKPLYVYHYNSFSLSMPLRLLSHILIVLFMHYTNSLVWVSLLLCDYLCIRETMFLELYPWIHMNFTKCSILFVRYEVQRHVWTLTAYDMAE